MLLCNINYTYAQKFNEVYSFAVPNQSSSYGIQVTFTSDSAFLLTGAVKNGTKLAALKVNKFGDTLWSYIYEMDTNVGNWAYSSIQSSDGNYVIGGHHGSNSLMQSQVFLIKLNQIGDTIWTRSFGITNQSDRCHRVRQARNNNIVLCGLVFDVAGAFNDFYLAKTDSNGMLLWNKTFGGANSDFAKDMDTTTCGGYIVAGTTSSYGVGPYNIYLVKTDSLGNKIWDKTYGGPSKDYCNGVVTTSDGGYALAGGTYISTDTIAAYIVKTDSAGNVQWEKRYKGIYEGNEFTAIKQLPSGELVLCGHMEGKGNLTKYFGTLTKVNPNNGDVIWERRYQHFIDDDVHHYFYGMDLTNDSGMVMCGMTVDWRPGANPSNQMWLVKTDSLGCAGANSIASVDTIYGDKQMCANTTNLIYETPGPIGSSFSWNIPAASSLVSGQGTNSIIVNQGNSGGLITVTESNVCGTSTFTVQDTITIYPVPNPNITMVSGVLYSNYSTGNDWQLNGNSLFSFDNSFKPKITGTYSVKVTNQYSCEGISNTYFFQKVSVLTIHSNDSTFVIFPNPTNGELNIEYHITELLDANFDIVDLTGRKIVSYKLNVNENHLKIENLKLPQGIYFYEISGENEIVTSGKLVVFSD